MTKKLKEQKQQRSDSGAAPRKDNQFVEIARQAQTQEKNLRDREEQAKKRRRDRKV